MTACGHPHEGGESKVPIGYKNWSYFMRKSGTCSSVSWACGTVPPGMAVASAHAASKLRDKDGHCGGPGCSCQSTGYRNHDELL